MTIEFNIREQAISPVRPQARQMVVANSQNYLRAGFSFSEEWSGIITAVFEHPAAGAKAVLVGSDGSCLVPWEVIQPPYFTVGAFCGSRVTSNRAQVFVQESVSLDTEATADPTPTVYEQIITLLEQAGSATGGIAIEKDPTVPAWVKAIRQSDIDRWNDPPTIDLADYLKRDEAAREYQPAGEYVQPDALTPLLSKTDAAENYQPKGNYQPAGSYMKTTDPLDLSRLRDASEDNTFGAETTGLVSKSINRLLYYKSDAILNANEVFRTGAYGVKNTDEHMPYLTWWYMLCFCKNEEMKVCVQWAFPVRPENNGELWLRTCRGSEEYFGEWKRVAITDQITALEQRVAALEARQ